MLEPKNQLLMNTFVEVDIIIAISYILIKACSLWIDSVRENCNLFILFEQRGKVLISIYQDFFDNVELSYNDFAIFVIRYGKSLIIILSLI